MINIHQYKSMQRIDKIVSLELYNLCRMLKQDIDKIRLKAQFSLLNDGF